MIIQDTFGLSFLLISMIERRSERISYFIDANIRSESNVYNVCIENLSTDGIECMVTAKRLTSMDFSQGKIVILSLETKKGKPINMNCIIKWYIKAPNYDKAMVLGMKILNPPQEYREMVEKDIKKCSGHISVEQMEK